MIIDRIQLAGLEAYFQVGAGGVNLGGQNPLTARTKQLGRGKQLEISAIELLIESGNDLTDLFNFNFDTQNNPPTPDPLFSITLMKEMFPALFADPFRHRVHNISGFEDFKRGTMENAKVLDVEGIPTIVSIGTGICTWKSPLYPMPEPINLNHASWELAASTRTPPGNFKYSLKLATFDANQAPFLTFFLANNLDPTKPRKAENCNLKDVGFYQIEFTADVTTTPTTPRLSWSRSRQAIT